MGQLLIFSPSPALDSGVRLYDASGSIWAAFVQPMAVIDGQHKEQP